MIGKARKAVAIATLMLLSAITSLAQQAITVKGNVTDALGPVPGVSVIVAGTSIGTLTGDNGEYSLPNVPSGSTLQFSFMGYKTVNIPVNGKSVIDVTLEEDNEQLEELVVIGYGTVRKSDVTGSVASVGEEKLAKAATNDLVSALQGHAAGVSIVTATGDPSATAQIKIRGTGTTNNTDPLYVVDGFPMSSISHLSPNDISSIEILKDASACAIYGSRGANGVIMITTRQAAAGAVKVHFSAEYGIENAPRKPAMLTSEQYVEMANLANMNSGIAPAYSITSGLETTDWFKEVMQTGVYQNYSFNMNGGSEKASTMVSANYFNREGTVKTTNFSRINLTSNSTFKPFSWLKLNASFMGSFAKNRSMESSTIFLSSLIAPPNVPVWDDVMNYYTGINVFRLANPAGVIYRHRDSGDSARNNLVANFNADVKLFRDLTFTSRFGYKYSFGLSSGFNPTYYETSNLAVSNNSVSRSTNYTMDWTWENMLNYNHTFGKVHEFGAMVAMSARDFYTESYSASRMDLPDEKPELRYLSAATNTTPSVSGSGNALGMLSYLARINYTLMSRYILTASFRADGSSRFVGDKKWGYFPSGAFAWKISEEPFFKNMGLAYMDSAKFRIGWGQIGNEQVSSYYPYQTSISQGQYYIFGHTPTRINGAAPNSLGNKELQWETSEQFNIGLDLAFLNNRLTFTGDYFIRKTDNILLNESVPRTSGTNSITRNVGGMENKGFEFTLGWKDDIGDFSYSIDGNISLIKNEVTNLGKAGYLSSSFAYTQVLIDFQGQFNNVLRSEPGRSYNEYYGYKHLGIFQNQGEIDNYKNSEGKVIMPNAKPGDSKFADLNDDGSINSSDMTFIGSPHPKATYGLDFNFSWKNIDLSMLWQGVAGIDIFNASKFYFNKFDGRQNILAESYKAGWSGEGSTNTTPVTLAYSSDDARNSQNWWQSTMYVEDGSYLRLRNVQLGYNFKPKFFGNDASTLKLYMSAQNLITFTKYSGLDPEIPGNGIDRGQYPQPRTLILGISLNY